MTLRSAEMLREMMAPPHSDPHRERSKMDAETLQGMLQVMMAKIARVNQAARERAEARTMGGNSEPKVIKTAK